MGCDMLQLGYCTEGAVHLFCVVGWSVRRMSGSSTLAVEETLIC